MRFELKFLKRIERTVELITVELQIAHLYLAPKQMGTWTLDSEAESIVR